MQMHPSRPPLALPDYQRIFRVIKTVLDTVEANTPRACIFFSLAGTAILQEVYKVKCAPVAGAAAYAIDKSDSDVLLFGRADADGFSSSPDFFHCWVQCDDYAVDFMAPIFRESLMSGGFGSACPRKMFQKSWDTMAASHTELCAPGDFYLQPDVELTRHVLNGFMRGAKASQDLVNICLHWYRKPPKAIAPRLAIQDNHGVQLDMRLSDMLLSGVW